LGAFSDDRTGLSGPRTSRLYAAEVWLHLQPLSLRFEVLLLRVQIRVGAGQDVAICVSRLAHGDPDRYPDLNVDRVPDSGKRMRARDSALEFDSEFAGAIEVTGGEDEEFVAAPAADDDCVGGGFTEPVCPSLRAPDRRNCDPSGR
jgi:hypothetical protein